jgi:hypothetical protein
MAADAAHGGGGGGSVTAAEGGGRESVITELQMGQFKYVPGFCCQDNRNQEQISGGPFPATDGWHG